MLAFAATVFALIVVPGPSVLFVVSRAVTVGRRAALATVVGNAAGVYAQGVFVAFGLGALMQGSVVAFTVLKLAGAAYLVFLGVRTLVRRGALADVVNVGPVEYPRSRALREGFVVGITNPKALIIFTAVLPQFVDRSAGGVTGQLLVLGLIAVAIALASDSVWALAAGTAGAWLSRSPRRIRTLDTTAGVILVGLGVSLAFTHRSD